MRPSYFDIHSHPNFAAFNADRDEVVQRARDAGVWLAAVGTQKDTSREAVELAEKYPEGVCAIIGLHPIHTSKSYHDTQELGEGGAEFTSRGERFEKKVYLPMAEHAKTVAIGECGLDYYRVEPEKIKVQEEDFLAQIELANEVGKPLMLHVRSAYEKTAEILKSHPAKAGAVVHCFTGTYGQAKLFLDLGYHISFSGVITYPPKKNPKAGEPASYDDVVRAMPLERIMADTDAPYLSPVPHRGKRNEPAYVSEIVKKIAEIRGEDLEMIRARLLENALKFFNLSA